MAFWNGGVGSTKMTVTPLFLDSAIFYSCKRKLQRYHDQWSINLNIRLMYFQFNRHCSMYEPAACKIEKLRESDFLPFPAVFVPRSHIKIKIWRAWNIAKILCHPDFLTFWHAQLIRCTFFVLSNPWSLRKVPAVTPKGKNDSGPIPSKPFVMFIK